MHKILWNFELQTDQQIPARKPDLWIINKKKTSNLVDFTEQKFKKKQTINKYLDLARGQKTLWNMRVTVISIVVGVFGTVPKGLKNIGRIKDQRKIQDHTDNNIMIS